MPWVAVLVAATPAHAALRFALGIEATSVPFVLEAGELDAPRFGLRPVLEVEPSRVLSFGAYTPFTLVRLKSDSVTGGESVFALSVQIRRPTLSDTTETLWYLAGRGGLATLDGRLGAFVGGAVGVSVTALDNGRGLFGELTLGHVGAPARGEDSTMAAVDRWLVGLAIGVVFRLGGDDWIGVNAGVAAPP